MVEDRNFDYKKEGDHKCKMLMVFMMMGRQSKWWESLDLSQHCKKSDISRKKLWWIRESLVPNVLCLLILVRLKKMDFESTPLWKWYVDWIVW